MSSLIPVVPVLVSVDSQTNIQLQITRIRQSGFTGWTWYFINKLYLIFSSSLLYVSIPIHYYDPRVIATGPVIFVLVGTFFKQSSANTRHPKSNLHSLWHFLRPFLHQKVRFLGYRNLAGIILWHPVYVRPYMNS